MTAIYLVAVVLLVLINGFFVAAEFALVRVRRARIEAMAKDDDAAARVVLEELDEINEYLRSGSRSPRSGSASWASRPSPT